VKISEVYLAIYAHTQPPINICKACAWCNVPGKWCHWQVHGHFPQKNKCMDIAVFT
jgi:hypothetical protein